MDLFAVLAVVEAVAIAVLVLYIRRLRYELRECNLGLELLEEDCFK